MFEVQGFGDSVVGVRSWGFRGSGFSRFHVRGSGFRGSVFGVSGAGCGVEGFSFGFGVCGFCIGGGVWVFRSLRFPVRGFKVKVSHLGFLVSRSGFSRFGV